MFYGGIDIANLVCNSEGSNEKCGHSGGNTSDGGHGSSEQVVVALCHPGGSVQGAGSQIYRKGLIN